MSISELTEQYSNVGNVPNQVLYEFLTDPCTIAALKVVAGDGLERLGTSNGIVHSVRSRIVNDPAFTAGMTIKHRAETMALFFPEYTKTPAAVTA